MPRHNIPSRVTGHGARHSLATVKAARAELARIASWGEYTAAGMTAADNYAITLTSHAEHARITYVFATEEDQRSAADAAWWETYRATQSQTQANAARANITQNSRVESALGTHLPL